MAFEFMRGRYDIVSTHVDEGLDEIKAYSTWMIKILETLSPSKPKFILDDKSKIRPELRESQEIFAAYAQSIVSTLEGVRNRTVHPLKDFHTEKSNAKKKMDKEVKKLTDKLQGHKNDLAKFKTASEKALLTCKQKAGDPKIVLKAKKDFAKYEDSHQKASDAQKELFDKMLPATLRLLEDIETTRLMLISQTLADFSDCFRRLQKDLDGIVAPLLTAHEGPSPQARILTLCSGWLDDYGPSPPPEPVFYELPCRAEHLEAGQWDAEVKRTAEAKAVYEEEKAIQILPPPPTPPGTDAQEDVDKSAAADPDSRMVQEPSTSQMKMMTEIDEEDNICDQPLPAKAEITAEEMEGLDEKGQKRLRTRNHLAFEVLSTEQSYLQSLKEAMVKYAKPLQQAITDKDSTCPINQQQHDLLFKELNVIYGLNRKFFGDLVNVLSTWSAMGCLGQTFSRMGPFFRMYVQYISNLEEAQKMLTTMEKNEKWTDFQNVVIAEGGRSVKDLIVQPMQRIPRYKMLIEELLKNTPDDHPDKEHLKVAETLIYKVALDINRQIGESESRNQLFALQNEFAPPESLITPSRRLVKRGKLHKKSRRKDIEYEFFLFNDMLAYASVVALSNKYKMHNKLPIDENFGVSRDDDKSPNITITSAKKSFVAFAGDAPTASAWYSKIKTCHEEAIRGQLTRIATKTITAVGSPTEAAGVKPVWKQDKEATECFICKRGWTVTRRRHHCRRCGHVVCQADSKGRMALSKGKPKVRVCDTCKAELLAGKPGGTRMLGSDMFESSAIKDFPSAAENSDSDDGSDYPSESVSSSAVMNRDPAFSVAGRSASSEDRVSVAAGASLPPSLPPPSPRSGGGTEPPALPTPKPVSLPPALPSPTAATTSPATSPVAAAGPPELSTPAASVAAADGGAATAPATTAAPDTPAAAAETDGGQDDGGDDSGYESGQDHDEQGKFPPGWVMYETEDTPRRRYYFNAEADTTVWERPE